MRVGVFNSVGGSISVKKRHTSSNILNSVAGIAALAVVLSSPVYGGSFTLVPGDLIVSRSVYEGTASTVTIGQTLPGGGTAIANGSYPNVFQNATVDSSFGVTSPILLDQITTSGAKVNSLNLTAAYPSIVTSFSSKSELALNLT